MASLVLGIAGEAVGNALLGSGISIFGATLSGAAIGGAIGAFAGSEIDATLAPGANMQRQGPRLSGINIQSSTEGAPIPRVFGRMRVAGQLIWATNFKETSSTAKTSVGGKGGGSSVTETDYAYSISFAVGLCAGRVAAIGRAWANGNLLDLSPFTTRFYPGDETQPQDPLIQEIEGEGNTPAYRGLSYIVFEDMPLAAFGNRIPQLQFEIVRPISDTDPGALENVLPGVALIPGAGEFVYATDVVTADDGAGATAPQNAHSAAGVADIAASLDRLQALAPNIGAVSLVAGWFGGDLRCGDCTVKPGVENATKQTYPEIWSVNGIARDAAHVVSTVDGRPAYGGTPSDESVVQAIADLKARGWKVMFCPFLFMDVPQGNALTDPYTGANGQPAYPWRGRITCDPAPGVSGSPDKTSAAAAQVSAFFGGARISDFIVNGAVVSWTGGSDWGYRRMVLHYAHLCAAAGGVDSFLIGSELRGLTRVRDGATSYPAVAALKALAADVRAILGSSTKIGYAADWSEYNNHQTGDAPGAVLFNLDPLWSDANIDFIGIDNYMPLSDWRDGTAHLDYDAANGPTGIHDAAYLTRNIRGGEGYDWYYASDADRAAQTRAPVTDALGKPWVWRAKDFWNWWSSTHYDRAGGSESASATDWAPQSKPIVFTELGCPAVDKGSNQPNVFVDPKSSESFLPYYSNGTRDDLIQRRFLEAHLNFWTNNANNPVSSVYSGRMVDIANTRLWCWDARPYPAFPALSNVWGDAGNYTLGHWLNGRLGAVQLADLVAALCEDANFTAYDVSGLTGIVTGFAVTGTMSPRDAITPLSVAYHFDAVESEGVVKFRMRGQPAATALEESDLVMPDGDASFGFSLTRAQETDLPLASRVVYIDAGDYRQSVTEARRLVAASDRVAQSTLPIVMDQAQASGIGARLLQDAWVQRETAQFALAPSWLSLDPADEVELSAGGRTHRLRLNEIGDAGARGIQAIATDPSIYEIFAGAARVLAAAKPAAPGRALTVFLDLPLLGGDRNAWAPLAAAYADPWPGSVFILRSATDSNFQLDTALTLAADIGETTTDLFSGPAWRWDDVNSVGIKLYNGTLASQDDLSVFAGGNALAIENEDGGWEILQFAAATLTAPGTWMLSRLLRGQAGTEGAMRDPVLAGARAVVLNNALQQLSLAQDQYALPFQYLWGPKGKPISDSAYRGAELQFEGIGMRPLAPCQLGAVYADSGDLRLSWIRRDRSPGSDGWDQTEIPMSETAEAYDVEILDGAGAVKRALNNAAAPLAYSAAQIAADFPSGLPSPFRFTVYQLSSVVGRGAGKTAEIFFA
ncbi:MAG: glycoside hydrolase/phage tail family protein [Proteobacteria bacterium]|nr:glycoside hydrolase/phage tail family protein [Pseudomonadota bacterium]